MIQWQGYIKVYLHREPVDFCKAINGLSIIVQDTMSLHLLKKRCTASRKSSAEFDWN